jgi:hypothetical protein
MPVALIKPNKHLRVKYKVPRNGLVDYSVEADRPVTTFIVDDEGLKEFYGRGDEVHSYYGGFPNRRWHQQELKLPFKGNWYLIILNEDDKNPAATWYNVDAGT